jgi:hypothetical protein
MATTGLAFLAGILSTLSPCVLPLLPIVLGSALNEHRAGPFALAAGLALSFIAVGLFVATVGFSIGLDGSVVRTAAGILLIAIGIALLTPRLQAQVALVAGPVEADRQRWRLLDRRLAAVCRGCCSAQCGALCRPTLGAASVLASQRSDPALSPSPCWRSAWARHCRWSARLRLARGVARWRGRLLAAGQHGKLVMGGVLIATGLLIVSNLDKAIETFLVDASPAWLNDLTTRF